MRAPARLACALWVILLVSTPVVAGQSAPAGAPIFEIRHGVIVDAARGALYLGKPNGGIEAVELSTGRSLWTSGEAALPLALDNRLLLTQAEQVPAGQRLRLVVLDACAEGRKVVESLAALPPDVRALVADELGRSFRATAERDQDGFLVSWLYKKTLIQGIRGEPPPQRTLSGTARVVVRARRRATARAATARPPRCVARLAERLMELNGLPHLPWLARTVFAITQGGRGGPLTLKRWDACKGEALPDRILSRNALAALPSADWKHVLISQRVGSGGSDDPEYQWSIFSLETAERVGDLRRDASAAPFFVWNNSVIFESQPYGFRSGTAWIEMPLEILAIRLSSGGPIWNRAIRDLEYRGPTPPVP